MAERLSLARKHGAIALDLREHDDIAEPVRALTGDRGPDAVIDAVGMEAHGSPVGRLGQRIAGMLPDAVTAKLTEKAGVDRLSVEDFATHWLPLEDAPQAYKMYQQKQDGAVKVLFQP